MPKVTIYNQEGTPVGEHELSPDVFQVPANPALIHQVIVALSAQSRQVLAHTKQRGEVRGGGKKPWKQKHTGRARVGSIRSPLWRHGGVVFGPRSDRNYSKRVNKKMKQKVLRMVLSDKVHNNHFILLDQLQVSDAKTKTMVNVLNHFPVENKKEKVLFALGQSHESVRRAARNIPSVATTDVRSLDLREIVLYPYFVTTVEGVEAIQKLWGKK